MEVSKVKVAAPQISDGTGDAVSWRKMKSMVCLWALSLLPSNFADRLSFKYLLPNLLTLWTLANKNHFKVYFLDLVKTGKNIKWNTVYQVSSRVFRTE